VEIKEEAKKNDWTEMPDEEGESEDEDIGVQGKEGQKTKPPKIEQKEEKKVYTTVPRQKTSKGDYIVTGFVIPDKKVVVHEEKQVCLMSIADNCRKQEGSRMDRCFKWMMMRKKSQKCRRKRLLNRCRLRLQSRSRRRLSSAPRSRSSRRIRRRWMSSTSYLPRSVVRRMSRPRKSQWPPYPRVEIAKRIKRRRTRRRKRRKKPQLLPRVSPKQKRRRQLI
jgi:hypothetical protein